ncbi:MAG: DUF1297 domain-containing protein [Candidatus Heimdallarchaeota archaeon]|nr:DUF1297 domain-containing protein [Candidatus Heimdallarchaeota archaeon]MDH5645800.1 DUF1297 domain-containing protein [Candidatus Heimdallarchaeota archaeon]
MTEPTIAMIGSHSAEEIAISAKANDLKTVVFCQKGRDKFYSHYNKHLFDHILVLEKFSDILEEDNQNKLQELNSILIPNRSLTSYLGYEGVDQLNTPIYGNRNLQKIEDRNYNKNQYWLMDQMKMRKPIQFSHDDIPSLAIVKVQQKHNPRERAFFYVSSVSELQEKAEELIKNEIIDEAEFNKCVIEEFVLGPRFNANFHAFGLPDIFPPGFEFVGFDDRVQTNLQGILNLPAKYQLQLNIPLTNEEVGHKPLTMRESKKVIVYDLAETFIEGVKTHFPPSMIGMFALQGAMNDKSEFIIFDISPRIPGAPILGTTSPEMRRLSLKYKQQIQSPIDLTMMEIKYAVKNNLLDKILT